MFSDGSKANELLFGNILVKRHAASLKSHMNETSG
jgi:hypothetical protein